MQLSDLRGLTIWQPWAQAIALGFKRYETRSWSTRYRGPLLIHAAKRWTKAEIRFQAIAVHNLRMVHGVDNPRVLAFEKNPPLGAVVCVADLVECRDAFRLRPSLIPGTIEGFFGDFSPGRFAWQLENVRRLVKPVPCKGRQGLWYPDGDLWDAVETTEFVEWAALDSQ